MAGAAPRSHRQAHMAYLGNIKKNYPDILYVDSLLEVQVQSSQGQSPYYLHDMTLGYVCSSLELVTSCFMNMVS